MSRVIARFYEMILEEIQELSLDDVSRVNEFVKLIKKTLPDPYLDPYPLQVIHQAWCEKLKAGDFTEDVFGLQAFLEELQRSLIRPPHKH